MMPAFAKQILDEALFWVHFAIILGGLLMGLVFPLWAVVSLVAAHRLHLRLAGGECIVSKLQAKTGGLNQGESYLQDMVRRFFNRHITQAQVKRIDHTIISSSVFIAALRPLIGAKVIVYLVIAAAAVAGVRLCVKLYKEKQAPAPNVCMVGGSCAAVRQSGFNSLGGVPVEIIGVLYFVLVLVLLIISGISGSEALAQSLNVALAGGFLASAGFIFLQVGVIKSICRQCMNVHAASLTLAIMFFLPFY